MKVFPEVDSDLDEEVLQEVRNGQKNADSKVGKAMCSFRATVERTSLGCVLFKLRFASKGDLEGFNENLESGLLTRLFTAVIFTDVVKKRYKVNEFRISFTIVDRWKYDMCQTELASIKGRLACDLFAIF